MMHTPIRLIPTRSIIMIQLSINGVGVAEYPFVVGYQIDGVTGDESVDGFGVAGPDADGPYELKRPKRHKGDPKDTEYGNVSLNKCPNGHSFCQT